MQQLKLILRRIFSAPLRVAIVDDQRSWRGIDLYVGALHLAKAIRQTSDRPHVGIMLPTSGMFPMALIAVWMLGRTAVPLNYLLKPEELRYVIDDAELDCVITVTPMIEHLGGDGALPSHVKQIRLDQLRFKGIPPLRFSKRRPNDFVAVLLYTSGTSGRPKGVMLTAGNLSANIRQCCDWVGFTNQDVLLGVLPQFHSFGFTVLTLLPLAVGAKVLYTARFVPKKIVDLLRTYRPTAFIAIPSMYGALLGSKSAAADDFKSLKYIVSGGEPLPEAVFNGFRDRFNVTINEGYGLTETSPVTNWCRPHEYRKKSVGKPLPGVEEIIVSEDVANSRSEGSQIATKSRDLVTHVAIDAQRNVLSPSPSRNRTTAPNVEGEIRIKGPNVMKGYYKLPEQTAAAFDENGYFKTGDIGRFDEDGFLYITGRIKEMLIIGGENVFPREIEEVLDSHPDVQASAVIGEMDDTRGEVPVAFVELKEGATFDERALRSYCREHLAQFKVPRDIRVLEKLPRSPTGKVLRRELKAIGNGQ
jgi:long-chain acyl-CoA synthetase